MNYDELRQAAKAASVFYAGDRWQLGQNGNANVVAFGGDDVRPVAIAVTEAARELIAACDPHLIIALLDENEALRAALSEACRGKVVNNWLTGGEDVCLQCGQLPDSGLHDENCWVPKAQALGGVS